MRSARFLALVLSLVAAPAFALLSVPGARVEAAGLVAAAPVTRAASPAALESKYTTDVNFLLDEFEKQAGELLKAKKIDWNAVRAEFKVAAAAVKTDVEHVKLCARLVARLEDGHATLLDVAASAQAPAESTYGTGLALCEIGNDVYVKASSGPALASGVEPGARVVTIDGKKAREWLTHATATLRDERGFSTGHAARYAACHWSLAGPEGRIFVLEIERAKGKKKVRLTCTRSAGAARMVGASFVPPDLKPAGKRDAFGRLPSGFGYVALTDVAGDLPGELDLILKELGPVPGLVLDLRANNGGGTDHEEVFGRFLAAGERWKQYTGVGEAHYTGPIVVIVDAGTRSTGETVAGMFKEDGRAFLIGPTPTAGMSAQKTEVRAPSALFSVRFAVASNKQRFNGGKGIEGLGVPPHEIVPWDPTALAAGRDPLLVRAEELLMKGFPKGAVEYDARVGASGRKEKGTPVGPK